jgi:hypothetical protein
MPGRGHALNDVGVQLRVVTAVAKHTRDYGPLTVHELFRSLTKTFLERHPCRVFPLVTSEMVAVTAAAAGWSPVVPPLIPKELGDFWKIGAIHPLRPVSFFLPAGSFPPLCTVPAASCC